MSDEEPRKPREYVDVLEKNIAAIQDMLTDLKDEMETEWRKVRDDGGDQKALEKNIKQDIGALVSLAIKEEGKLHEQNSQRSGRAGEYAIDLGQARADIGGRLARLRDASRAGRVSG